MFVVLVGLPVRAVMAAEQRQQLPLGIIDFGVRATPVRRLERLGKVESEVDGDQRVESKP